LIFIPLGIRCRFQALKNRVVNLLPGQPFRAPL